MKTVKLRWIDRWPTDSRVVIAGLIMTSLMEKIYRFYLQIIHLQRILSVNYQSLARHQGGFCQAVPI